MRRLARGALLLVPALASCALWAPGEDPRGRELRDKGTPVLAALVKFHAAHGRYPDSLHQLVPSYLREVPFELGLNLDTEKSQVYFVYSSTWPQTHLVGCAAALGQVEWSCRSGGRPGAKASGHY
jgi:hypothetical protein